MIVVDANILVYHAIEPAQQQALVAKARTRDRQWIAPELWRSEFRNALLGYLRHGLMSLPEALDARVDAELAVTTRRVSAVDVLELGASSRASAYDLEYVALARALRILLVTADRPLSHAFPDTAVLLETFAG